MFPEMRLLSGWSALSLYTSKASLQCNRSETHTGHAAVGKLKTLLGIFTANTQECCDCLRHW